MTRPRKPNDLMLAPVAVAIDQNLQQIREKTPAEIGEALALSLDIIDSGAGGQAQRAEWIRRYAVHMIELHNWDARVTDDGARLRLEGGSVTVDLGLSASILRYITDDV